MKRQRKAYLPHSSNAEKPIHSIKRGHYYYTSKPHLMRMIALLWQVTNALPSTGGAIGLVGNAVSGNISWLLIGIAFFVIAAILFYYLKNLVVNTILGIVGWGILTYIFNLQLPFWASLIVSAVFGLAGLGAIVILAFLGIVH